MSLPTNLFHKSTLLLYEYREFKPLVRICLQHECVFRSVSDSLMLPIATISNRLASRNLALFINVRTPRVVGFVLN